MGRAVRPATVSQSTGIQRETARRKRCDRLIFHLSRGDWHSFEPWIGIVEEFVGDLMQDCNQESLSLISLAYCSSIF
jgi:hypothetical protein